MEATELRSLVGLSMLILAGGAVGSFGLNSMARTTTGRSAIRRCPWWGLGLYYLAVAGTLVAGVGWILRTVVSGAEVDGFLESPWFFLTFGLVVGLPFTLPVVTGVWREQHPSRKAAAARQKPASRQARLKFAKELEQQVREYGGDSRTIDVELHGDKGTILFFKGDLTREEGERLVAALRGDFKAGGFQRVEGQGHGKHGKWWVRV